MGPISKHTKWGLPAEMVHHTIPLQCLHYFVSSVACTYILCLLTHTFMWEVTSLLNCRIFLRKYRNRPQKLTVLNFFTKKGLHCLNSVMMQFHIFEQFCIFIILLNYIVQEDILRLSGTWSLFFFPLSFVFLSFFFLAYLRWQCPSHLKLVNQPVYCRPALRFPALSLL
jgi:hypothetical protein